MHNKTTAKAFQYFTQSMSFPGNYSAGKKAGLLQGKRIIRVTCGLQRLNRVKLSMNIHIPAVKNNLLLRNPLQCHLHRLLPVQKNSCI